MPVAKSKTQEIKIPPKVQNREPDPRREGYRHARLERARPFGFICNPGTRAYDKGGL